MRPRSYFSKAFVIQGITDRRLRRLIVFASSGPLQNIAPQVAIVPGFLHREFPDSGADGRLLIEAANDLGWHHGVIPVESTGRLLVNAKIIFNWLKRARDGPWVLASISKGGSDIAAAMQLDVRGEAFRNIVGWVDVCGILRGSPVVDRVSRQWFRMLGFRGLFALRRWCFASVLDCVAMAEPWKRDSTSPDHMNVVHAVGFPNEADFVRQLLVIFISQIGTLGPNDGADPLCTTPLQVARSGVPGIEVRRIITCGLDFRVQPLCRGLLRYAAGHQPVGGRRLERDTSRER